jgi:hypothetical protein
VGVVLPVGVLPEPVVPVGVLPVGAPPVEVVPVDVLEVGLAAVVPAAAESADLPSRAHPAPARQTMTRARIRIHILSTLPAATVPCQPDRHTPVNAPELPIPVFAARYEHKYLIDEEQAAVIRQFVDAFCSPDPHGDNGTYDVISLYLDTWDWLTAMDAVEGLRNRFKLRIRTYGFGPEFPIFVEDKGRIGTSIVKERALVHNHQARAIARGDPPPEGGFQAVKPAHAEGLERFRDRMDQLDMTPRLWVKYQREAWGSAFGDGARLTFDRHLEVQTPDHDQPFEVNDDEWLKVPLEQPTILELKFNGAFPFWMERLVHGLQLERLSVSKYVRGVAAMGDVPWNRHSMGSPWSVTD